MIPLLLLLACAPEATLVPEPCDPGSLTSSLDDWSGRPGPVAGFTVEGVGEVCTLDTSSPAVLAWLDGPTNAGLGDHLSSEVEGSSPPRSTWMLRVEVLEPLASPVEVTFNDTVGTVRPPEE